MPAAVRACGGSPLERRLVPVSCSSADGGIDTRGSRSTRAITERPGGRMAFTQQHHVPDTWATSVSNAGPLVATAGAAVLTGRAGGTRLPARHRRRTVSKARWPGGPSIGGSHTVRPTAVTRPLRSRLGRCHASNLAAGASSVGCGPVHLVLPEDFEGGPSPHDR